ncbi:helix-turn-helix domain-containing protein [Candidatus Igneacidithiobacillus taiwanensis]|uniref:helix-turn-helix domain-containing protein n=1 Tax=Candidatus Igneacidithiobacillus taiwanensis TaxID=1945924 RepID=UPI0028A2818B|nr:helix-turn-helix domain-containing protein [Candidatus Igneacidithiobacillus taiwanensis]
MYIPEQIKAVRLKAGLTQAQAAELIGYSKRAWQDWEQGRKPMRDAAMDLFLLKLAVRDAENEELDEEQVEGAEREEREACESDHAEV